MSTRDLKSNSSIKVVTEESIDFDKTVTEDKDYLSKVNVRTDSYDPTYLKTIYRLKREREVFLLNILYGFKIN